MLGGTGIGWIYPSGSSWALVVVVSSRYGYYVAGTVLGQAKALSGCNFQDVCRIDGGVVLYLS
jgi:hypothetical protein